MPPKIMVIIATDNVSGPAKGIFQFLVNIKKSEAEYLLYNFKVNQNISNEFIDAATELGIKVNLFDQKKKSYISLISQAICQARSEKIDIVQTHGFKPSVLGFFVQFFCKVKWICFMHGATSENFKIKFYNFIDNIAQMSAARTILVSEAQRCKLFKGNDELRVRILHNAINVEQPIPISLKRQPVRELLGLPTGSRLLVVVGRLSPEKGIDVFLDAISRFSLEENCIHAIIVGDGQERERLKAQAAALNVENNVHFVGFTKTPGDYLIDADIVVVPSRSEGIPNAVLEAMSMGKPVVATDVGGVPEIIEDGISGYLVPSEQPVLLADAIKIVLGDASLYSCFVVNGKQRMKEYFDIKRRVSNLVSIYNEVLSERS